MFFKAPSIDSNKYSRGAVGICAGSKKYPGAGFLTVEASLKSGAGIIFYYGSIHKDIVFKFPEVVVSKFARSINKKINCFLVGSGNPSKLQAKHILKFASKNNIPAVVDANAMSVLLKHSYKGNFILTPHAGEYRKIAGNLTLSDFAKSKNYTIILKGYETRIAYPNGSISTVTTKGSEYLSTAGTGDILSGLLSSKIAQFGLSNEIIESIVKAHQTASVLAAKNKKPVIATDIIRYI